jgi:hypothetical protein
MNALTWLDDSDRFGFGQHDEHGLSSFGADGIVTSDFQFEPFILEKQQSEDVQRVQQYICLSI